MSHLIFTAHEYTVPQGTRLYNLLNRLDSYPSQPCFHSHLFIYGVSYEFGTTVHEGEQMTELLLEWLKIWTATTQLLRVYSPTKGDKESGSQFSQSSLWLGARHFSSSREIESPVNYGTVWIEKRPN